jgi:hypothetical protein
MPVKIIGHPGDTPPDASERHVFRQENIFSGEKTVIVCALMPPFFLPSLGRQPQPLRMSLRDVK